MRFNANDDTAQALRTALIHEFFRAEDAFNDFVDPRNMTVAAHTDRRIAYRTYNFYSRFIHHLYEFYIGCFKWQFLDTAQIGKWQADQLIHDETSKLLARTRARILEKRAPVWENSIESYPLEVPPQFASEFRKARNIALGHVGATRTTFSLSKFFGAYHMFMLMLYDDARWLWTKELGSFPDLGEVTSFALLAGEKSQFARNLKGA